MALSLNGVVLRRLQAAGLALSMASSYMVSMQHGLSFSMASCYGASGLPRPSLCLKVVVRSLIRFSLTILTEIVTAIVIAIAIAIVTATGIVAADTALHFASLCFASLRFTSSRFVLASK